MLHILKLSNVLMIWTCDLNWTEKSLMLISVNSEYSVASVNVVVRKLKV